MNPSDVGIEIGGVVLKYTILDVSEDGDRDVEYDAEKNLFERGLYKSLICQSFKKVILWKFWTIHMEVQKSDGLEVHEHCVSLVLIDSKLAVQVESVLDGH